MQDRSSAAYISKLLNADAVGLLCYFPQTLSSLPVRGEIVIDFFLSLTLSLSSFFLLLKGGGLIFPNSTLMKEARLLMLYYRASPVEWTRN